MAFTDYKSVRSVVDEFGLEYEVVPDLFPGIAPQPPGDFVSVVLRKAADAAIVQRSEKARSEAIIYPYLFEATERATQAAVVYSGLSFSVTPKLSGIPDFIVGRGKNPSWIVAPLLAMVEAKEEKFGEGAGSCAARMVAARDYNKAKGVTGPVFGGVTSGAEWQFYKLIDKRIIE